MKTLNTNGSTKEAEKQKGYEQYEKYWRPHKTL